MNMLSSKKGRGTQPLTPPEREHPLAQLRHEIDGLFGRFLRGPFGGGLFESALADGGWGPEMDVTETDQHLLLKFELPGVAADDIDISVSDGVLTLRGEKTEEHNEGQGTRRYTERRFGSFARSVTLPGAVDPAKVDATFKNGVLTVQLEKRPEATPKKIKVKSD